MQLMTARRDELIPNMSSSELEARPHPRGTNEHLVAGDSDTRCQSVEEEAAPPILLPPILLLSGCSPGGGGQSGGSPGPRAVSLALIEPHCVSSLSRDSPIPSSPPCRKSQSKRNVKCGFNNISHFVADDQHLQLAGAPLVMTSCAG